MSTPHPIDVHVGKRLRLKRNIMGLSQDSIASAIGITFQQVQKYERGVNRMGASRLYQFSRLLNVPVSYFFEDFKEEGDEYVLGGMAEPEMGEFEHDRLSSRETLEMMRAYYRIESPIVRKRTFELIKSIASMHHQDEAVEE